MISCSRNPKIKFLRIYISHTNDLGLYKFELLIQKNYICYIYNFFICREVWKANNPVEAVEVILDIHKINIKIFETNKSPLREGWWMKERQNQ